MTLFHVLCGNWIPDHDGISPLGSWYERNKHIFPASRWETYDPEKKWDKYTIADFNG